MSEEPGTRPAHEGKRSRDEWLDAACVFLLAYGFSSLLPDCFDLFDESLVASVSERLVEGELLYRDIFVYWLPGAFWLQEWIFERAGVSVAALRVPFLLAAGGLAVGVWRLCGGQCGRSTAILAGVATPIVCVPVWWMSSPHWYSTLTAILAAIGLRSCMLPGPRRVHLLLSGGMCGISLLFLQPVGALVSITLGFALVWDRLWLTSAREAAEQLGLLALGALLPVLGVLGYFAWQGALAEMFRDTVLWNFRNFAPTMEAEYGAAIWMPTDAGFRWTRVFLMWVPPLLASAALLLSGARYFTGNPTLEDRWLFVLAVFSGGLLIANAYYPDVVHLAFGAPPAFALLAVLGSRLGGFESSGALKRAGLVLSLFLLLFVARSTYDRKHDQCDAEVATQRGVVTMGAHIAPHFRELFAFLDAELEPGERFYVYPYGPGLNFLSGHLSPAPLEGVMPHEPGYFNDAQLASVTEALKAQQIRLIVVSHLFGPEYLRKHHTEVERYIRGNYRPGPRFGRMQVLVRKGASPLRGTPEDPPRR